MIQKKNKALDYIFKSTQRELIKNRKKKSDMIKYESMQHCQQKIQQNKRSEMNKKKLDKLSQIKLWENEKKMNAVLSQVEEKEERIKLIKNQLRYHKHINGIQILPNGERNQFSHNGVEYPENRLINNSWSLLEE